MTRVLHCTWSNASTESALNQQVGAWEEGFYCRAAIARAASHAMRAALLVSACTALTTRPAEFLWTDIADAASRDTATWGLTTEQPVAGTLPERSAVVSHGSDVYRVHYDDSSRVQDVTRLLALVLHLPHTGAAWGLFDANSGEEQWEEDLFVSCASRGLALRQRGPDSHRVTVVVASESSRDGHVVRPAIIWRGRLRCNTAASDVMLRLAPEAHSHSLHDSLGKRLDAADRLCSHDTATGHSQAGLFFELRPPFERNRKCAVVLEPHQAVPLPAAESGVMAAAGRAFATAATPLLEGEDVPAAMLRFPASRVLTQGVSQGQLILTPLRLLVSVADALCVCACARFTITAPIAHISLTLMTDRRIETHRTRLCRCRCVLSTASCVSTWDRRCCSWCSAPVVYPCSRYRASATLAA